MQEHIDDIEKLIHRRLDGELGSEEELQLDRELIRTPQARRLMEEYARVDELAGEALDYALADEGTTLDVERLSASAPGRSAYPSLRWVVPGAVAAAILAVAVARAPMLLHPETQVAVETTPPHVDRPVRNSTSPNVFQPRVLPNSAPFMREARSSSIPMRVHRDRGRDTVGILGEDGNFYWIEVDRTRTVRHASPQLARQWATGGV